MSGWVGVACEVSDVIRHSEHVTVYASRTGETEVFTEWGIKGREVPVLREWRFPSRVAGNPDLRPCRHEVPTREDGPR